MSGDVWKYAPREHKTAWHGHARVILIGPKGQAVLRPFLSSRPLDAFLFSAAEAEAERRAEVHAARVTPPDLGNIPGSNRQVRPQRKAGDHYDVASYRRAIARGCVQAAHANFPPPVELDGEARSAWVRKHREAYAWHPHQLRHNCATEISRMEGIEVARIILGHKHVSMTELYAEADLGKAAEVVKRVG
jgi:integrase